MSSGPDASPIRVVVIDDHPVVRKGLQVYLEPASGIEIIGEAGDGTEGLRLVRALQPDVLILDVCLPGAVSGLSVAQQVCAELPEIAVLGMTAYGDLFAYQQLREFGVPGYLRKSVSGEEVIRAVRRLAAGVPCSTLTRRRQRWRRASPR